MVSEWPNCLGHAQIGIVSFLNSNFTTSFPLCFTGDSSRGLGPVGKYLSGHDTNTRTQVLSSSASEEVLDITCSNYSKMSSKVVFKFSSLFDMITTL